MTPAGLGPSSASSFDPSVTDHDSRHRALKQAAQEFEAMFLQEVLKPLSRSMTAVGAGADASEESSSETYAGYAVEALSKAVAAHDSFGISQTVVRQVEGQDAARTGKATNSH